MRKSLKTLFVILVISCMMFNPAYASVLEAEEGTDAGVTPDSIWYTFDRLIENVQLALEGTPSGEADLLLAFARERLAEASVMEEEDKEEFLKEAMDDYLDQYEDALERIAEAIIEDIEDEAQDAIVESAEESEEAPDGDVEEESGEEDENIDSGYLVAKVVEGLDSELVLEIRGMGLGYGQIAQVFTLAEYSGEDVIYIAGLFGEDAGFGDVAKILGFQPSEIKKKIEASVELEDDGMMVASEDMELDDEDEEEGLKEVEGLDPETVQALRDMGLGYGQMKQALILSKYADMDIMDVAAYFTDEEVGYGDVAKILGLEPSQVNKDTKEVAEKSNGKSKKIEVEEEAYDDRDDEDDAYDDSDDEEDVYGESDDEEEAYDQNDEVDEPEDQSDEAETPAQTPAEEPAATQGEPVDDGTAASETVTE